MSPQRLVIALVLLAALGGGVYWSNRAEKEKEGKPAADAAPVLLKIPDNEVQKIEIRAEGAEPILLNRSDAAKWDMMSPKASDGKPYAVDVDTVLSVMNTVSNLSSDRVVEDKPADLKEYGLAPAKSSITITRKNGKTDSLEIGDDAPAGASVFVKLAGDSRVFTMASSFKASLLKSLNDLRDKRLLVFDTDKVSRIELNAKKQDIEFARVNSTDWQIVKPQPLRADGWQVEELIRKLREAKMDLSASDEDSKKASAAFASATPVATAKITDPSGTKILELRKSKDDFYAKSSMGSGVYKVNAELGNGLDKSLDNFRNRKLFDFAFNEPSKITVKTSVRTLTVSKQGEKWMSDKQMDSTSVQAFLDKARDIAASKFAAAKAMPAATLEVTVLWENGKRSDHVLFAKQGETWFAQRENEPSLYEVEGKDVADLERLANEIKEPAKPADAPKK
jgi:hypothetical protein